MTLIAKSNKLPNSRRATRYLSSASCLALALAIGSAALVSAPLSPPAAAADWTGAVSTDWFAAGNWSTGAVPTAGDDTSINLGSPVPTVDGAAAQANAVIVGDSADASLLILNTGTLGSSQGILGNLAGVSGQAGIAGTSAAWTNSGDLTVGNFGNGALVIFNNGAVSNATGTIGAQAGSIGTATVDGAGSTWTNSSELHVGSDGTGVLTISNGGAVSSNGGYVGSHSGSSGSVTVTGAGSTWTTGIALGVGYQGAGALTIAQGGTVTANYGDIGLFTGGTGAVTVDGAGSALAITNDLVVGFSGGTGTLTVQNGGSVTDQEGTLGSQPGSIGTANVTGVGSTWTNAGDLVVGHIATGALSVSSGGAVSSANGYVGRFAGSIGTVIVTGAGSTWANSGSLTVGNSGVGELNILNGGAVSNSTGYIGFNAGSTGAVTVDGPGSTWTSSSGLSIGGRGTGTLTVKNGGTVSSVGINGVGEILGSTGTVLVDGAGSAWIGAGFLSVGVGGAGMLTVSNGGAVSGVQGTLGDQAGAIGTVAVTGAGSTWTNTGNLIVGNSGTGALTVSNGGAVSDALGIVASNAGSTGTATVDGAGSSWSNSSALLVGLDGSGTLMISNGGTVSNTTGSIGSVAGSAGNVTVDAATWVNSADLLIGSSGTGALTIANGGVVSAGGLVTIAADASAAGTLNIGSAAGAAAVAPGTLNTAAIQFGAGIGAVNFNHTSANYVFAPSLSGPGAINQIAGNTNMSSDSSGFTGTTNVSGGRLAVNGSLANSVVTVSGGILGGNGIVGSTAVLSGGTIAPGNSIGTLNVNGNVAFAPGAIYQVEVNTSGQADKLAASGTAALGGGTVSVLKTGSAYMVGSYYTILTASGGVTGAFAGVSAANATTPFLSFGLSYDSNNVYLDIARSAVTYASVGLTRNQIATGAGADGLNLASPLAGALVQLDAASARGAFDQLSGEVYASARTALIDESWLLRGAMNDRLRSAFGAVGAQPMATMSYGFTADLAPAVKGPMPTLRSDRFAVWGQGYGSWGRSESDRNAAKLTRSTGGLMVGADIAAFDTMRFGALAGYSRTSFDSKGRSSSGSSDNYHLGLYGGGQWGALGLRTGASYTWHGIDTSRTVAFAGFGDGLKAGYDAGTAQVFGELGYRIELARVAIEPFAGLAYVNLHSDGFRETGRAAALTARGDDTSVGYSTLGLRASTSLALQGKDLTLRGALAWRHAFGDVTPVATLAFAGSSSFTVAGIPIAKNAALVEAGLDLAISPSATLGLSYTGQLAEGAQDHAFKGNLAVRF